MKITEFDKVRRLLEAHKSAKEVISKLDLPDTKIEIRVVPVYGDPSYLQPVNGLKDQVQKEVTATIRALEAELTTLGVELDATT